MSKPCPYCAQTHTRKDWYGYCKKHHCFEVSGAKQKLEDFKKELEKAKKLPTLKQNMFDGTWYNPQKDEIQRIYKQIEKEFRYYWI